MKHPPSPSQRRTLRRCAWSLAILAVLLVLCQPLHFFPSTPAVMIRETERSYALTETELLQRQSQRDGSTLFLSANENAVILTRAQWKFLYGWDSVASVLTYLPDETCCIGTLHFSKEADNSAVLYVYGRVKAAEANGVRISIEAQQVGDETSEMLPESEWCAPFLYQEQDLGKGALFENSGYHCFYAAFPMEAQFMRIHHFTATATPLLDGVPSGEAAAPLIETFSRRR